MTNSVREARWGRGRWGRGIGPGFSMFAVSWLARKSQYRSIASRRGVEALRISDAFERSVDSACDTHFQTWRSL